MIIANFKSGIIHSLIMLDKLPLQEQILYYAQYIQRICTSFAFTVFIQYMNFSNLLFQKTQILVPLMDFKTSAVEFWRQKSLNFLEKSLSYLKKSFD